MHNVMIDQNKCIGCGACVSDCVGENIQIVNGTASVKSEKCIFCGHCEAICPVNAVTLSGFADKVETFEKQIRLDPEELMNAIKTRRSIRQFQDREVDQKIIDQIIEAGRLAPTGSNSQTTSYIVLKDKKNELEAKAVSAFRTLSSAVKPLIAYLRGKNIDDHFFFKNAPVAILICSGSKLDAGLAAENMAFMAEAHGLGVLYSGFFTICANTVPGIKKVLDLKDKKKVITTLVIGYPDVKYRRTVHREAADVKIL